MPSSRCSTLIVVSLAPASGALSFQACIAAAMFSHQRRRIAGEPSLWRKRHKRPLRKDSDPPGEDKMSPLILRRAPIGWNEDDFDVLEDGVIVGRIFKVPIAPQDQPWMWASGHNGDIRRAAYGYEAMREPAMVGVGATVSR
jgi:hypothetical protein